MTTEFFSTHLFKKRFLTCLARGPRRLCMVVPYIGKPPLEKSVGTFALYLIGRKQCEFQLITAPPDTRNNASISRADADLIAQHGGTLIFRTKPMLHSKIYQFFYDTRQRAAFVGSANFSKGGFDYNDEAVAFSEEKAYNDAVAKEILQLSEYGTPFSTWRTSNGKDKP